MKSIVITIVATIALATPALAQPWMQSRTCYAALIARLGRQTTQRLVHDFVHQDDCGWHQGQAWRDRHCHHQWYHRHYDDEHYDGGGHYDPHYEGGY